MDALVGRREEPNVAGAGASFSDYQKEPGG
jgi:hypothetical protein